MMEYSFFIDTESCTIGVAVDDSKTLSIGEYNALADKEKPSIMELMQLLLNSFPETIDDFKERLVLVDDPEWDIREQLMFIRGDGGEDIINRSFKADRTGVDMDAELLPGITYQQLFENTVDYKPASLKTSPTATDADDEKEADDDEQTFSVSQSPRKISIHNIVVAMKMNPVVTAILIIAFITLVSGVFIFYSTPDSIILAPDRLQKAALVDQQLNELKVNVDNLWNEVKGQVLLPNKEKKSYWQKLKPLNLQYRELRRSGFGHGNKFKVVNAILKKIRERLRPKKKAKTAKPKNGKKLKQAKKKVIQTESSKESSLNKSQPDKSKVAPQ
jgi:hypothetical protein